MPSLLQSIFRHFRAVLGNLSWAAAVVLVSSILAGCGPRPKQAPEEKVILPAVAPLPATAEMRVDLTYPVMVGVDTLEADGFAAVRGKKIGLLTHPAGVNRRGESTVQILWKSPACQLVALFAPEHGLYGTEKASAQVADTVDALTGLPVYSLHGHHRKPTSEQLKGLDALVIDLQDIGVRSYTFNVVMRYAMDSCFRYGVEVIVLDRPNPLGGLKVDGPSLDTVWRSGVGAYPIPYVHGLTMGELARFAADTPGVVDVPEELRVQGKLTVVPMRGWRRAMRWPETGLNFVPTSQYVRDFDAVIGYAMTGLGCEYSGFTHGLGTPFPFRSLLFRGKTASQLEKDLVALQLPGLKFRLVTTAEPSAKPVPRVWVEIADWEAWNPTELSFHLHRLACRYGSNPFAKLGTRETRSFNIHVGSTAWWEALTREGAFVDVEMFVHGWRAEARAFQEATRKYRLYD